MRRLLLILSLFAFVCNAYGVVYYVSATGDDGNAGTSQSAPWQTITKVNSMMSTFNPGDQILFKKGDSFYGTITVSKSGSAGNEIIFGSYGTGALPEITGFKALTSWTFYSGNTYRMSLTDSLSHLYIGSQLMTLARYPNSGFLKIDAGNGKNGFYDAALTHIAGYWNGANCRVRTVNWSYETKLVSNFSGGNVTFSSQSQYATSVNYGYYFDNKMNLLDVANEWYKDYSANMIYFYAPGGVNPNTLNVRAAVLRDGISMNLNVAYIKVQDIKFIGFRDKAVNAPLSTNITVKNCEIYNTTKYGILLNGSNGTFEDNKFEDNLNVAIGGVITGVTIKGNSINRTGFFAGYGESPSGYMAILGTSFQGSIVIESNTIDSSGYSGMFIGGDNCLVKNNIVTYSLLTLNDGAGIDIIKNSNGLQVLDNVIGYTKGNVLSSGNPAPYGSGIYINAAVISNSTLQGNTIHNCTYAGMLYDHKNTPSNNMIQRNTFYNNYKSQFIVNDWSAVTFVPQYTDVIKNNIFYSLSADQSCMEQVMFHSTSFSDYGSFDSNYYCNPYSEYVVRRTIINPYNSTVHTLPNWKSAYNEDPASKSSQFTFSQFGVTDTLSGNMITNSTFNSNINEWDTWPSGSNIAHDTHPLLDGGVMRVRFDGTGYPMSFTASNSLTVTLNHYYLYSFSVVGAHVGTMSLWGRTSNGQMPGFFPFTYFSYDNVRKDYSFIAQSTATDPNSSVTINLVLPDSLIYIDNVNMYRVSIDRIDSTEKSKLFMNETSSILSIPLGSVSYKDLDGNPVGSQLVLQPYSSKILVNENFVPTRSLNLKVLIQGLYNSGTNLMDNDTATVIFRNSASPYGVVDSAKSNLGADGSGQFVLWNAVNSVNYYLIVKHRNSIETWSKNPVTFVSNQLSYDFTTSNTKAYGDNMILSGSKYCIYSGDINRDEAVDVSDIIRAYNEAQNFLQGYVAEDLNGDEIVDLSDINIAFNNAQNFVVVIKP